MEKLMNGALVTPTHDPCPTGSSNEELRQLQFPLTHWGRVTHICVSIIAIIGSDNGLSPGRRQAITWTNVGILLIGRLGTNFSEIFIEIHTFSSEQIHLKMTSGKWRPFCLCLNVLSMGRVSEEALPAASNKIFPDAKHTFYWLFSKPSFHCYGTRCVIEGL